MKTYSLRRQLVNGLVLALVAVWALAIAFTYIEAHDELDELGDLRLLQAAYALSLADLDVLNEAPRQALGGNPGEESPRDDDGFGTPSFTRHNELGHLLWADPQSPQSSFDPHPGLRTIDIRGVAYRTAAIWHSHELTRVYEPHSARETAARSIVNHILVPLAFALPMIVLVIWWLVSKGLAPLQELARTLARRDARNLEPLRLARVPSEALPAINSVNALMARLDDSLATERRFTSDAAHELRTPLAGLRLQAQVALGATSTTERDTALHALIEGVDRSSHLLEQLLVLARADRSYRPVAVRVDLVDAATRAVAQQADTASRLDIALSLDAPAQACLMGEPALIDALLRNLIDNALRYTPTGGRVEVVIAQQHAVLALRVIDNGPGIPADQRQRVLERFTRLAGQDIAGSGLGLSIVARIAELHGAALTLADGADGRGLSVQLEFPSCE